MLKAAKKLLLEKGVEATSVDDVLKATKTGKSQFYHYFGSKAGMVDHVIDHLISDVHTAKKWCGSALPDVKDWAEFEAYLQIMGGDHDLGHPVALIGLTIRPENRLEHLKLVELYETLMRPLTSFLKAEQEAGRFLASANAQEMAQMAMTNMLGASVNKVIEKDAAALSIKNAAHHTTIYCKAYARVA